MKTTPERRGDLKQARENQILSTFGGAQGRDLDLYLFWGQRSQSLSLSLKHFPQFLDLLGGC